VVAAMMNSIPFRSYRLRFAISFMFAAPSGISATFLFTGHHSNKQASLVLPLWTYCEQVMLVAVFLSIFVGLLASRRTPLEAAGASVVSIAVVTHASEPMPSLKKVEVKERAEGLVFCAKGDCAICLQALANLSVEEAATTGLLRLPCGHTFHGTCADHWLAARSTCPMCRQPMPGLGMDASVRLCDSWEQQCVVVS